MIIINYLKYQRKKGNVLKGIKRSTEFLKNRILKKSSAVIAASIISLSFIFTGCTTGNNQAEAAGNNKSLTTVRQALMTNGFDYYVALVGLKEGIYKKYGIDLQTTEYGRGINTMDAVANGTADIGNLATYAVINRIGNTLKDTNLVIISEQSSGALQTGGLYVAPQYANNLKALDGSKGFISIRGTVSDYSVSKIIEYLGFDEKKQNIVQSDSIATNLAIIKNNEASAIYTDATSGQRIEQSGWVLAVPSEQITQSGTRIQGGAFFLTTRDYNEKNKEAIGKWLKATEESFNYIMSHMDESAEYIAAKSGINPDDFKKNWESIQSRVGFTGQGISDLQEMEKWAYEHGNIPEDFDITQFIDYSAAKEAIPDKVTAQ